MSESARQTEAIAVLKCPHCRNKLLQKSGRATKLRTRGPILFMDDGRAMAQCYWCKGQVEVPVEVRRGTPVQEESFYLPPRT